MNVVSEAEACRWLGRRVSLMCDTPPALTGRLQHVSSRSAFMSKKIATLEPSAERCGSCRWR